MGWKRVAVRAKGLQRRGEEGRVGSGGGGDESDPIWLSRRKQSSVISQHYVTFIHIFSINEHAISQYKRRKSNGFAFRSLSSRRSRAQSCTLLETTTLHGAQPGLSQE